MDLKELAVLLLVIVITCSSCKRTPNKSTIVGQLVGRTDTIVKLVKSYEDSRYNGKYISIDSAGRFSFDIKFDKIEAFKLIFESEMEKYGFNRPIPFLTESDTIFIKIYPLEKSDSNRTDGSSFLNESEKFYSAQAKSIDRYLRKWSKKENYITLMELTNKSYMELYQAKHDSLITLSRSFALFYLTNNINLTSFDSFLEILKLENMEKSISVDRLKEVASKFQTVYPNHPYNKVSNIRIRSIESVVVNSYYFDFSAYDMLGNQLTLSEVIKSNNFTLLDLWCPWCGPCIKKSLEIIPIYEKYNKTGFEVVGVVGGIENKQQFINACLRNEYPWKSLAEISNQNNLWEHYGIPHSGGSTFLFDSVGKIIAINPDSKQLEYFLNSN